MKGNTLVPQEAKKLYLEGEAAGCEGSADNQRKTLPETKETKNLPGSV